MAEQNGSGETPRKAVARHVGEFSQDLLRLAELQLQLLGAECQEALRRARAPALLLLVALLAATGCVPVLLLALAELLAAAAELSAAWALLLAGLAGAALAAAAGALALWGLRRQGTALPQSRDELARNIDWVKEVLRHRATPPSGECERAPGPPPRATSHSV